MRTEIKYKEINGNRVARQYDREFTIPCVVLCAILFLILGVLYITPGRITGLYRPAFIFIAVFSLFRCYPLRSAKWQIALAAYFAVIFICNNITNSAIVTFISHELFIFFFLLASERSWSRREIRLLLDFLIFSCTLMAVIVLFSNSLLLHAGRQQRLNYLGTTANRNSLAFAIVMGAIASLLKLINCEKSWKTILPRLYWTLAFVLCAYDVFAIGCRSAFFSMCLGIGAIVWDRVSESETQAEKLIKEILIIAFVLIGANILYTVASGTYSSRLFKWEESGREEIWKIAGAMIRKKPIFGGGYEYWASSNVKLGTHNTYLTSMLEGGIVAFILVIGHLIALLFEIIGTRSIVPFAFLAETLFHNFTESGMDYYAYIPLIFAVIIARYLQYQGSVKDLFAD